MNPATQSMLEKIQKLLNLANDKGATEGERDNAMRFAHKLLAKHNLTMAQVEQSGHKGEDRGIAHTVFYGRPWATAVAKAIADLCFCHYAVATAARAKDTRHFFIGKESNALTAGPLAQFIVESILKESRRRQRALGEGNTWGRSFAMGAALTVNDRVQEIIRMSSSDWVPSNGTALVLASVYQIENTENQKYVDQHMPDLKPSRPSVGNIEAEAALSGMEYAYSIPLNRQLENSND